MHISKYQLEVLLSSCLRFADLRLSHTTFNDLEDLQTEISVCYQQLLDGDKDEVTIENLTQYIIDLI
jgi:hypothetical protein